MSYKEKLKELAEKLNIDEATLAEMGVVVESAIAEGIAQRETEIEQEIRESIAEYKDSYEQKVVQEAIDATKEYIAERQHQFETSEKFRAMEQFVESIQTALSEAGVTNAQQTVEENARIAELEKQLDEMKVQVEESKCANYLTQALSESNLSSLQKDRVLSVLSYTKPNSLQEFKSIVDTIIAENAKTPAGPLQENKGATTPQAPTSRTQSLIESVNKFYK